MASITRFDAGGVAIFAPAGAGAGAAGITFTDYHYYADLAGGATYTPTAETFATFFVESYLGSSYNHIEFYDGGGWINAFVSGTVQSTCAVHQDNVQSLRVHNGSGGALKFSLTGVVWTGFTDYHYYTDLASAATYTPTAQTLATLFNETYALESDRVHVELYDGGAWVDAHRVDSYTSSCLLCQDNAQSLRIHNANGSAKKISLTGGTWS